MDGLMFDTERLGMEAWQQVGRRLGYNIPEEVLTRIRGATPAASAEIFHRALGASFDYAAAKRMRNELVEQRIKESGLPVKTGLTELLQTLKRQGIPAAVASSSPCAMVRRYLELVGVAAYFTAVIGAEDITRSKPAPDCFLLAASRLGVPPEGCLVLEDSANGLLAAKAARMRAICIPDIALPSMDALQSTEAVLPTLAAVWPWLQTNL